MQIYIDMYRSTHMYTDIDREREREKYVYADEGRYLFIFRTEKREDKARGR